MHMLHRTQGDNPVFSNVATSPLALIQDKLIQMCISLNGSQQCSTVFKGYTVQFPLAPVEFFSLNLVGSTEWVHVPTTIR